MNTDLKSLSEDASNSGFILRIQVRRPLNLWSVRVVVATYLEPEKIQILGEMKAWAYARKKGFQLDTMRVRPGAPASVGHLVWSSTMAWALEATPCEEVRLLAIRDEDNQHVRLVRYFEKRGFRLVREVGSKPNDLALRTVWGGAGTLMMANCQEVFSKSYNLWKISIAK